MKPVGMRHSKALVFILLLIFLAALAVPVWYGAMGAGAAGKTDVVVVGAGIAGLITAYELEQKGLSVHVLEALDRFGGRVATAYYEGGLEAEYGMHEIWAACPLNDYVKKFNLPLSSPQEPYSSTIIEGRYFPYVQDTFEDFLKTLFNDEERREYFRWRKTAEGLYDQTETGGLTPELKPLQDISFAAWMGSLKLPSRVAEYVRQVLECEIATDWDTVSAVYGIIQLRQFLHKTEQCRHVKGGNMKLIEAFVEAVKGPKTLNARVTRIVQSRNGNGAVEAKVYYNRFDKIQYISARAVVVSAACNYLHAIQMEPSLTEEQWDAINSLGAGQYTVVHLVLDTKANALFKVNGKLPFPVISRGPLGVIYGILEDPPRNQKEEIFTLLVHGDYARTYLEPQDNLRNNYVKALDKIWPGFASYVKGAYFYGYHPGATPAWPRGRSPLDAKSASLQNPVMNMYLVGDYIYSSHVEGSVISGRKTAERIEKILKK
jgi:monoamine oxidase